MKAIGFNIGQRGDLVMNTAVLRAFKEQCPDCQFTFGLGPQYVDMIDLFRNHPLIDDIHVFDSYDNWPNAKDREYLSRSGYNYIFNGMPNHTVYNWWDFSHQIKETMLVHGVKDNGNYQCFLNQYFKATPNLKKHIALAPFAGFYNPNNNKRLSFSRAQELVDKLLKDGYSVLQLGGSDEPELNGAFFPKTDYFTSIRNMLGCKYLISTDTGIRWVASAYKFPTIGLDSNEIYGNNVSSIQPINPNAKYLSAFNVNEIEIEDIMNYGKSLFV